MTGGFFTATIEQGATGPRLVDGTLAARWRASDLFAFVHQVRVSGEPFCTTDPFYPALKNQLCSALDILSSVGSPTSPCDAISIGIAFRAEPASLGAVVAPPAPTPGCPPATDPANDHCP